MSENCSIIKIIKNLIAEKFIKMKTLVTDCIGINYSREKTVKLKL